MCLGVPGQVLEIRENAVGMTMGKVSFGGITKDICLAYVPEVQVDDFVLVHVGFALSIIDEQEAREVFAMLRDLGKLDELAVEQPV